MRRVVTFTQPYAVEVRQEDSPPLTRQQVRVEVSRSAISAGTELLFYRGQVPANMSVDAVLPGLDSRVSYPISYGYSVVGIVVEVGSEVEENWLGRRVFAFQPHATQFVCDPSELIPIPDDISDDAAALLPTMETAVNFIMDAQPLIGERVLVLGLGIVGLLTVSILQHFPNIELCAIDGYTKRTSVAHNWGVQTYNAHHELDNLAGFDPDLIIEVTSNPEALADAVRIAGFGARIVIGSWYGEKSANLPLGGHFHRNRVQMVSSQVSTIDARFSNRWTKQRRLSVAWENLRTLSVHDLISHRLPIDDADQAYALLDTHPEQALQVLLTY